MWSDNPFHQLGKPARTPLSELGDHPELRDPVRRTAARLLYPLGGADDVEVQSPFWGFWQIVHRAPDPQHLHEVATRWSYVARNAAVRSELESIVRAEGVWEGTLEAAYVRAEQVVFESLYRLAREQHDAGQPHRALALVSAALEHWTPAHDAPARRALRGCAPLQHRLPPYAGPSRDPQQEGLRDCLDALRTYAQSGLAWFDYQDVRKLMQKKEWGASLERVRAARDRHPETGLLIGVEISILNILDRNAEARSLLERELARHPDLPGGWLQKGFLLEDPEQQIECYRRAVQREPHQRTAWFALAGALLRQGHAQEARDFTEGCLELDPTDADAWYLHAHALHKLGAPRDHEVASVHQAALLGHEKALDMLGYDPREG